MCSLQLARPGSNKVLEISASLRKRCTVSLDERHSLLRRDSLLLQRDWSSNLWKHLHGCAYTTSLSRQSSQRILTSCLSLEINTALTQFAVAAASRFKILKVVIQSRLFLRCAPPVGLMIFGLWGLLPSGRFIRRYLFQRDDRQWWESQARNILTSYLRPLLLWSGVILFCRALDPLVLATEASQAIKQRILNFVRSLSTVLAFAYCASSLSQQLQKVMQDKQGAQDTRSVGAEFVGNTVYTAVWIAAVCLFMELLGFSTQKWLTAGGLGTVLLTLAGREIFTNFLSSIMIHATRPFIVNEWIQTKIEGYEVSGTVEHVGWWSPTIVRGDDREAVHIPNHKFTVSVVRNLSQKSHWRIKTYLGISHLHASKITSIVADMRKVISKHPQVEQRRLHRRVFLESIDPENQALLVLISCFVKTPHFEEYLRVKETILLDLLKVISHHHARLATPIRSVQRLSDDADSPGSPFRDMSRSSDSYERPYLLIEATTIAAGRDADTRPTTQVKSDSSLIASSLGGSENLPGVLKAEKAREGGPGLETTALSKLQLEGLDSMGLNSNDITLLGAAFEKPPAIIPDSGTLNNDPAFEDASTKVVNMTQAEVNLVEDEKTGMQDESATLLQKPKRTSQTPAKVEMNYAIDVKQTNYVTDVKQTPSCSSNAVQVAGLPSCKPEGGEQTLPAAGKPQLEENLVLGVALDGPKRMLPLKNDVCFSIDEREQKQLVASRNNNAGTAGKERKEGREGSQSVSPGPSESGER